MQRLSLSKGYFSLIDDDDYMRLSQYKWTAMVTGQHIKRIYAYRRTGWRKDARRYQKSIWLHREIMDAPKGMDVDHINHDTLDNRKQNLRLATRSQNLANNRRPIGATGFRGVCRTSSGELLPFKAQIKGEYLGTFANAVDAARAYDTAASKKFGEFARLNFPT
jgi:hypothetical protein